MILRRYMVTILMGRIYSTLGVLKTVKRACAVSSIGSEYAM